MSISLQPTLSNERVKLTPLKKEDFDGLYEAASDPLIWKQHPASDRWKREVFEGFFAGGMNSGGAFLIRDAQTNEIIGSSRYNGYDAEQSCVEIGWTFFKRSHWGGRYNQATKDLMLGHAFSFVDEVLLYAGEKNFRSCRAIERIGGVQRGVRDDGGSISLRYVVTPEAYAQSSSNR